MIKKDAPSQAEAIAGIAALVATQPESGATAATARLSKSAEKSESKPAEKPESKPAYKQRDPDTTAKRILVQGAYQNATVSPSLAGLRFDDLSGFQKHVEEHAQWLISRVEAQS